MTTIRAFFLQIRAIFSNFQKGTKETTPSLSPCSYAPAQDLLFPRNASEE